MACKRRRRNVQKNMTSLFPKPEAPDSEKEAKCYSFYGESWSDALLKAGRWLEENNHIDVDVTEPMIRMVHYSSYYKPFTVGIVVPE